MLIPPEALAAAAQRSSSALLSMPLPVMQEREWREF
jgi:hypothetical protein